MDSAIDVLILITLWSSGFALGLGLERGALAWPRTRTVQFARVLVLDLVVIPLAVWLLTLALNLEPGYATGLLIVGAASAGPLGIKVAQLANGDQRLAISLVIVLELANILVVPFWAALLLPVGVSLPLDGIIRTLVVGVLLPVVVGALVRRRWPVVAGRLITPASTLSSVGLVAVIGLIVARDGRAVLDVIGTGVTIVTALTLVVTLVGGWLAGAPDRPSRATAAMVTSVRANAPALAVAVQAFGATADPPIAITVFGVLSAIVTTLVAFALGQRTRAAAGARTSTAEAGT